MRRRAAPAPALDAHDLAILRVLQRDVTTPLRVIGAEVHLSAAAVQRRVQRLRDGGVIVAEVAVVEPEAVGRGLTVVVEVELEAHQEERLRAAKARFAAAPEVQQCYYVTGEADFVLVLTVPDMAAYEALTRTLFAADANVRRWRTFVAMERVKVGLDVPT